MMCKGDTILILTLKPILYYLLTPAHPLTGPICHVVDHSSLEWSCLEQTRLPRTYTRPRRAVEQANTPIIELSRVLIVWIKKALYAALEPKPQIG